jgi:hypothetical protein
MGGFDPPYPSTGNTPGVHRCVEAFARTNNFRHDDHP